MIRMGRSLELPSDAVARVMAFLGIRGSGKTYGAGKFVEGLLELGGQVVILDPVGTWWGLRLGANGRAPGFDIPVFGGEHGDIPLEPGAGALVADVVIDRGISVVLDVSRFRKAERKRFVTEFGEQLFHRKKGKRSAVHLVLEEAQVFAPQRAQGEERMLGAIEDLVRLGRNFGIGCTLISQRPQSVNKEVLNQAEALFLFRLAAAHERKAIQEWVVHHGADVGEMVSQLPSLDTGEAMVWSPQWLEVLGRFKIGKKRTFDASATPELGAATVEPRILESGDLAELEAAMVSVVEEAKAKDPKALRARIRSVEAELAKAKRVTAAAEPDPEMLSREREAAASAAVRDLVAKVTARDERMGKLVDEALTQIRHGAELLEKAAGELRSPLDVDLTEVTRRLPVTPAPRPRQAPVRPAARPSDDGDAPRLTGGAQRMIEALYRMNPGGLSEAAWATQSKLKRSGGTWSTYKSRIRDLVEERGGLFYLADAGLDLFGGAPPPPMTTEDLHAMWLERFTGGCRRMLELLIEAHPEGLEKAGLAEEAGISMAGGTWSTYLSRLRSNGLIEEDGTAVFAADSLFL